jgi:hypothetical protein
MTVSLICAAWIYTSSNDKMAHRPRSSTIASVRSVPSTHEVLPFKVGDSVKLRVAVHDNPQTGSSTPHILLNREYCPGITPGDIIRIDWADASEPCYFIVQGDDPPPASHIQVSSRRQYVVVIITTHRSLYHETSRTCLNSRMGQRSNLAK